MLLNEGHYYFFYLIMKALNIPGIEDIFIDMLKVYTEYRAQKLHMDLTHGRPS